MDVILVFSTRMTHRHEASVEATNSAQQKKKSGVDMSLSILGPLLQFVDVVSGWIHGLGFNLVASNNIYLNYTC